MRLVGVQRLSVRVSREEKEWLQQEADRHRLSIGELVRRVIEEYRSGVLSRSNVTTQGLAPTTTLDHGLPAASASAGDRKAGAAEGWDD